MVKIIERDQAHYESREMPFGKTYEWHPAYLVLECGCGKKWTVDAKSTITTCHPEYPSLSGWCYAAFSHSHG